MAFRNRTFGALLVVRKLLAESRTTNVALGPPKVALAATPLALVCVCAFHKPEETDYDYNCPDFSPSHFVSLFVINISENGFGIEGIIDNILASGNL